MTLKEQCFGIEIEMTGITRKMAADAISKYFGTYSEYIGTYYDTYAVTDNEGKTWKIMFDSSIRGERKAGGAYHDTEERTYRVELVSPKLEYSEMEKLQEVVRTVRKAGAKVNSSCGIHVHVDGKNHTAKSLRNLLGIMYAKEDLLFKALQVNPNRVHYCKHTRENVLMAARAEKNLTMSKLHDIWYADYPHDNCNDHYNQSRYHALNLHAMFTKGTVEFRLFNSTLHAGEVRAYITLALAISAQGINQKSTQLKKTESDNEKFTFRCWLLRLGLIGDEFTNVREHLIKHLDGNAAWRYDPSHYPTHPYNLAAQTA